VNQLATILRAAALDLTALQLRWAVVGGLAVSARTEPRFTRDVDLVIAVSDDQCSLQSPDEFLPGPGADAWSNRLSSGGGFRGLVD